MAWSVLQSASHAATGTISNTAAASFGTALTSGSKIIAYVAVEISSGATISSVKDTAGNSLTSLATATTASKEIVALYALDTPAGDAGSTTTITATVTSSSNVSILIQEVSGLLSGNTSAMLDGTAGTLQGNGGASTGSPTYSSAASNEFLVAVYGDDGGPATWTVPSGYTGDSNGVNGNSNADIQAAYKSSTGGSEAGSYSLSGSAADWGVILVAFQVSGGGGGPTSGPLMFPGMVSRPSVVTAKMGRAGAHRSQ